MPQRIRLAEGFRYVHEPLVGEHSTVPFLADPDLVESLTRRIRNSSGGSFLVTGVRGAGKTTTVLRALEEVEAMEPHTLDYLSIVINVARPVAVDELLFEVVRRLFEALIDKKILDKLSPEVRRALVLAYARTSLSFKETRSQSTEVAASLGVGGSAAGAGPTATLINLLSPKIGLSRKKTDSMATEASFLAYSHGDVEHDFVRIIDLVNREPDPPASRWRRAIWRLRGHQAWRGKVVVVLDELDKLTATTEGQAALKKLLAELKNILTTRNVHFIFVAGPDLHDEALLDASRGNSVFESVFACQIYVPCLWRATDTLLDAQLASGSLTTAQRSAFRGYLDYKARGVPRLLLRELNELVRFDERGAYLQIAGTTAARIAFYAGLQDALDHFVGPVDAEDMFSLAIDHDRWRLGAYYITDWILRRRRRQFTVSEILELGDGSAGEWLRNASEEKVQELLDHLVKHGFVEIVWDPATGTMIGDSKQERVYAVVTGVRRELSSFARDSERERGELLLQSMAGPIPAASEPPVALSPWTATESLGALQSGRYDLKDLIGRGGMGTVYRAVDTRLARDVAIKMLEAPYMVSDEKMRARFRREGEIAANLAHPGIVATYDTFEEPDGRLGVVMQLVSGETLRSAVPLEARAAVAIVLELLAALDYLAGQGIVRIDLKPENIILVDDRHPVIVDLGLVKQTDSDTITAAGEMVGTVAYMSPEQAMGASVDIRSDIFAVGLIMFEMLSGTRAFVGEHPMDVVRQLVQGRVDVSTLPCSAELREVIARATAPDPVDRFQTPADMLAALRTTPESSGVESTANAND